ncbi:MAG: SpoIIE family protein phosphatase [Vulcanimicrobiota bacterium]
MTINLPSGARSQDRVVVMPDTVILADGAGGVAGGEEAAQFFVDFMVAKPSPLWDAFLEVDRRLAADRICGDTTGLVVNLDEHELSGVSVGDSEAWLVTADTTFVLTEHQRRKPLLGSGEAMPMPFRCPLQPGQLLVASDGLFRYTSQEKIRAALAEPDPLEALVALVRLPGGSLQDDVAIALMEVGLHLP